MNFQRFYFKEGFNTLTVVDANSYDKEKYGIIRIDGELTSELVNSVRDDVLYLQHDKKAIKILMNSPGGSVRDGQVLVDLIEGATVPVDIYGTGLVASMGALIFAAAPKGHRHLLPSSQVMIHEPRVMGGMGGTATEMEAQAKSLMNVRNITSEVLARHTGHSVAEINRIIRNGDKFFTAEGAVAWGIADDIVKTIVY